MRADRARAEPDDEELMGRIAQGDADAFRMLAQRYMNLFYAVAYRMGSQRADAEDVAQEAMLRLWSKAHLWKAGTGAAVSTWLYRLTYNLCIDRKRREHGRQVELDESQPDDGGNAPDKKLRDKDIGRIVGDAVAQLPERQRAALVLCHYQGLSNAEAAEVMGTTVKGVEGLLVRARQTLQRDLKNYKGIL